MTAYNLYTMAAQGEIKIILTRFQCSSICPLIFHEDSKKILQRDLILRSLEGFLSLELTQLEKGTSPPPPMINEI